MPSLSEIMKNIFEENRPPKSRIYPRDWAAQDRDYLYMKPKPTVPGPLMNSDGTIPSVYAPNPDRQTGFIPPVYKNLDEFRKYKESQSGSLPEPETPVEIKQKSLLAKIKELMTNGS